MNGWKIKKMISGKYKERYANLNGYALELRRRNPNTII